MKIAWSAVAMALLLAGAVRIAVIEVLFEDRTLPSGKEIHDEFIAYGTHAYRIALP